MLPCLCLVTLLLPPLGTFTPSAINPTTPAPVFLQCTTVSYQLPLSQCALHGATDQISLQSRNTLVCFRCAEFFLSELCLTHCVTRTDGGCATNTYTLQLTCHESLKALVVSYILTALSVQCICVPLQHIVQCFHPYGICIRLRGAACGCQITHVPVLYLGMIEKCEQVKGKR